MDASGLVSISQPPSDRRSADAQSYMYDHRASRRCAAGRAVSQAPGERVQDRRRESAMGSATPVQAQAGNKVWASSYRAGRETLYLQPVTVAK